MISKNSVAADWPGRKMLDAYLASLEKDGLWQGKVDVDLRGYALPRILELRLIESQEPGKGHGTACMKWLCELADKFGVWLYLSCEPHDGDFERTWKWYESFGFRAWEWLDDCDFSTFGVGDFSEIPDGDGEPDMMRAPKDKQ